jgi:hypothetical protein
VRISGHIVVLKLKRREIVDNRSVRAVHTLRPRKLITYILLEIPRETGTLDRRMCLIKAAVPL